MLPRFFTAGDRADIGAVVINTTDQPLTDGVFSMAVEGATLESDTAEASFTLEPGAFATFDFPVAVDSNTGAMTVTMTAVASPPAPLAPLSDGVRIVLPVERYQTPEVVGTSGVVPPEGVTEAIYVPQTATDDGALLVGLQPSLAAGMIDGLTYLEHYPYECTEQTVSRFLPNLFTVRALRELGIEDPQLESTLSYQLGIGVQRLVSRQNQDGGWGAWPQEESTPFISAYVLWGLWNANQMGYTIPQTTLDRGATYLDDQFVAPDQVTESWQLNQMAFMHFVLAEMGQGDPGHASTLYDVRERLQSYGKAYLAMALFDMNANDARVTTLLDDLLGSAFLTASGASWHDEPIEFQTMSSDPRSTAVVLDAFTRIEPDQPILPSVVRWLMDARQAGRWATTQENAWSIIALTDWMVASGELEANYDWKVDLNDEELGAGHFDSSNITSQVNLQAAVADLLRDQADLLTISRSEAPGRLYYTTQLQYYLDVMTVEPLDRGIVVERRFQQGDKQVDAVQSGDIFSVTVTIVAPNDLYYALIEAPIPAGVEPIDPNLPTGPQYNNQGEPVLKPVDASQGGWYWWTPSTIDYRDDKVAVFATYLPAGTYEFTFQARAAIAGEFRVLPAYAEMMYFPEVWGRGAGQEFTVTKK